MPNFKPVHDSMVQRSEAIKLRAEGAINALDVAAPRIRELESALITLLSETPTSLSCNDFHHYPSDQHGYGEACPPKLRHIAALKQAQAALPSCQPLPDKQP